MKLDDNDSSRRWTRLGLWFLGLVAAAASVLLVLVAVGAFDDDANTKQNNVAQVDEPVALLGSASYDTSMSIEPSMIPTTGSAPEGGTAHQRDAKNPFSPR